MYTRVSALLKRPGRDELPSPLEAWPVNRDLGDLGSAVGLSSPSGSVW